MTEDTELDPKHAAGTRIGTEDNDSETGGNHVRVEDPPPGMAELEADIERTRENLAETVDRLAGKFDVKTRVRNRVEEARRDAASQWRTLRNRVADPQLREDPVTIGVVGGVAAAVVAGLVAVLWHRRRGPHRRSRGRR